MTERILHGPFLTRRQAAKKAGVDSRFLPDRPDLIHIGGDWLEEVYCDFQFNEHGIDHDVGSVVQFLHRRHSSEAIADWLTRSNRELAGSTPLEVIRSTGDVDRVLVAAMKAGPVDDDPAEPLVDSGLPALADTDVALQASATRSRRSSSKKRISPSGMRTARSGIS